MEIRPARPADLPALTAIYNHYVLHTAAVFTEQPVSVKVRRPWFAQFAERGPYRLLVAEDAGRVLGYTCSTPFLPLPAYRQTVETAIFLAPGHVRRGLGRRLYAALFEALAGERLHRAYAGIVPPNRASVALHVRFGFTRAGLYSEYAIKWGRYHSSMLWEKQLGPRRALERSLPPTPPAPGRPRAARPRGARLPQGVPHPLPRTGPEARPGRRRADDKPGAM